MTLDELIACEEQNTSKMTHDKMIDILKGLVFGTFDRTTPKEREALDMAIKALEQSKWIPVTEKLPEEVGLYLVTTNRLGYQERAIDGFVRGRWEQFGHAVIAWRPLPEAYKESEE